MSGPLSLGVPRLAATLFGLVAALSGPGLAVAASPEPKPLLQPICGGPVAMLAADVTLASIRLSQTLRIKDFSAPADLPIPQEEKVIAGKLVEDTPIRLPLLDITLPPDPSLELESADKESVQFNVPVTFRLDRAVTGELLLPAGTAVSSEGGRTTVAKGSKGSLSLAGGDLGGATAIADGERIVQSDDVHNITLRLIPSDNGPRLQTTAEAPGVVFGSLTACLVGTDGFQQKVEVLEIGTDGRKAGAALVTLAVPQSLSELTFDQFLTGDTTYSGKAYLVSPDGKYVGAGVVNLRGIKTSMVFGIVATLLLLSAIAAVRPRPSLKRASGVGPFFKGIMVGNSGEASLSLFQIALWTLITIFALVYVWRRTGAPITLTTEMLGLLGFAAVGSVAARWIAATRSPGGQQSSGPLNGTLRAAVETARRRRDEADALSSRVQELTASEARARTDLEAALAARTTAEQDLAKREVDLGAARERRAEAERNLETRRERVGTADDATRPQAEADVRAAEAELQSADDVVAECQRQLDAARAVAARSDEARQSYEQAIRNTANAVGGRDTAARLATEAEEQVAELRSSEHSPKLVEMLMTDGRLDLFKVQLFLFTTLTALYVAARVVTDMAFPPIGDGLLLLMGVSNGGYIAAKLAEPSPLQKAQALQAELDALDKRVAALVAEQKQLQDEDAAIRRSLAVPNPIPGAKEAFDVRLTTIAARLGSIEKDGKGELPDARTDAAAKRKDYQDQLAAATKAA